MNAMYLLTHLCDDTPLLGDECERFREGRELAESTEEEVLNRLRLADYALRSRRV
jgi:hypothetical protein